MDSRKRDYVLGFSVAEDAIQNLQLFKRYLKLLRQYEEGFEGELGKDNALTMIYPTWEAAAEDIKLLGEFIQKTYEPYEASYGPTHS